MNPSHPLIDLSSNFTILSSYIRTCELGWQRDERRSYKSVIVKPSEGIVEPSCPDTLCRHEGLKPELTVDGTWTGRYVCVTCGVEVTVHSGLEEGLYG